MSKRVTGIGGIFFKAKDPAKLGEWYAKNLDIELEGTQPMSNFRWRDPDNPERLGMTVWSLFAQNSTYFGSESAQFMINYRVDDLDALLVALKQAGVEILRDIEDSPYGRFAAIKDPEGNGIELWQPPEGT
ncbi:MAG TPA: VOC family protein [Aggregatilineales bacterium]|nr:VOC family protein [Aggregatilineales bacterium]